MALRLQVERRNGPGSCCITTQKWAVAKFHSQSSQQMSLTLGWQFLIFAGWMGGKGYFSAGGWFLPRGFLAAVPYRLLPGGCSSSSCSLASFASPSCPRWLDQDSFLGATAQLVPSAIANSLLPCCPALFYFLHLKPQVNVVAPLCLALETFPQATPPHQPSFTPYLGVFAWLEHVLLAWMEEGEEG